METYDAKKEFGCNIGNGCCSSQYLDWHPVVNAKDGRICQLWLASKEKAAQFPLLGLSSMCRLVYTILAINAFVCASCFLGRTSFIALKYEILTVSC